MTSSDSTPAILIADDRPEKLLSLEAALCDLDATIVKAASGREALRHLLRREFALILLDVNMPGMDGLETARLIRSRKSSRHTPIIFVTAYGDDLQAMRSYSLGAVDYILAPFVPDVLRTKVSVFLDLYRRAHEIRRQAESLKRHAQQLRDLVQTGLALHSAGSIRETLRIAADAARRMTESHQAAVVVASDAYGLKETHVILASGQRADDDFAAGWEVDDDVRSALAAMRAPRRWSRADLEASAIGRLILPSMNGTLAREGCLIVPLASRDGSSMGFIEVAGRRGRGMEDDEESVLPLLAQKTALAVENQLFAEAREANRMKDEFLATLSHELRTPLTAVLGWAQLLRMHALDTGETEEGLVAIEQNAIHQAKLIEDLLDISRIVSGKLKLNIRPTRLVEAIIAAIEVVRPAAEGKGVTIETELSDEPQTIPGDPDRLQQVFWNLLSNAVKFTPQGGTVSVHSDMGPTHARIVVRDDGQGINQEFLPYVFDRFRQADGSPARRHGGLGLGLAIVRQVVEQHGGTVRAESEGPGRGSTFTVALPRGAIATRGEPQPAERAPTPTRGLNGSAAQPERMERAPAVTGDPNSSNEEAPHATQLATHD